MGRKDDKLSNFLPLNRKFFNHFLWKENRTFSKAEAWIWLLAEARFDAAMATELIGGKMIKWNRGEVPASLRYLGEAWSWEKNQVDRFLSKLEKEKMIIRRLDQGQTIIKLINYEEHNGKGQQTGQQNTIPVSISEDKQDSKQDSDGTAMGQRRDKTNIVNNVKEREEVSGVATSQKTFSDEEIKMFGLFKEWMQKWAGEVCKMDEPLTIEEFYKLKQKLTREKLAEVILKMHNWKLLRKKNRSAYRTILNWSSRENNNSPIHNNKLNDGTIAQQIKLAAEKEKSS